MKYSPDDNDGLLIWESVNGHPFNEVDSSNNTSETEVLKLETREPSDDAIKVSIHHTNAILVYDNMVNNNSS